MSSRSILRFAAFELNADTGELRRGGEVVKLAPQPFKVLELLASHRGKILTRNEIHEHVRV